MTDDSVKICSPDGRVEVLGALELSSIPINAATYVSVTAVPVSYDVRINGDLVYSFNVLDNALSVSKIIAEDLRGVAYGKQSKT